MDICSKIAATSVILILLMTVIVATTEEHKLPFWFKATVAFAWLGGVAALILSALAKIWL